MRNIFKNIYNIFDLINQKYKKLFNTKLKYILQFFPSNIYLLILFISLICILTPRIINNKVCIYSTKEGINVPEEIINKSITQNIEIDKISKINELGIRFLTYYRVNKSTYEIIVYKNNKSIYKEKIDASLLNNDEYKRFYINSKVNKNDKLKFEIKPIKVKKGNGITIAIDKNGNYTYRLYDKSIFYNEIIALSFVFLAIFFVINALINNNKIKNVEHFYKLMIIYFISVVFIFPPLFEPDSKYHFTRSYIVSQNNIIEFLKTNNLKKGYYPSNIDCLNYGNKNIINEVSSKKDLISCFNSKEMVYKKGKLTIFNKIAFIFPAIGIKIAELFTNSPMIIYYLGRFFNALASFLIILYALKIAPKHKRIILSIVMIPVFIQQMCSYSYDSFLNSLCILIIAYLLKFFNDEKINKKDLFIYIISMLCILVIKLPYILIGLPILFVNKEKFGKKKYTKYLYIFLMLVGLGIVYLLIRMGESLSIIDTSVPEQRGISISNLFNIKYTLRLIYYTFIFKYKFYLETFIGGLGWLNATYISRVLIYFYLLFMCLGIASEKQEMEIKRIIKFLIILINIILIGGIFLALYLSWTMPEDKAIEGVQGRYLFAPILEILLCLIPKNNKIKISDESFYTFFNISCFVHIISMLYLFY